MIGRHFFPGTQLGLLTISVPMNFTCPQLLRQPIRTHVHLRPQEDRLRHVFSVSKNLPWRKAGLRFLTLCNRNGTVNTTLKSHTQADCSRRPHLGLPPLPSGWLFILTILVSLYRLHVKTTLRRLSATEIFYRYSGMQLQTENLETRRKTKRSAPWQLARGL